MNKRFVLLVGLTFATPIPTLADVLIPKGSDWLYLDNGRAQGVNSAFAVPNFDDSAWKTGKAQLGYGDGDVSTTVDFGGDGSNKFVTTYFRKKFTVDDPTKFTSLTVNLLRDDGAKVCINGTTFCVWSNLPTDSGSSTLASANVGGADENKFFPLSIPATALTAGQNVAYVEIHQDAVTSSDISFDLELIGNTAVSATKVIRGPYLQLATPDSVHIRWRTDSNTTSEVRHGTTAGALTQTVQGDAATLATDHELVLTGLQPGKRYWYSVGAIGTPLAGNDANTYFETPPAVGSATATRIWVIGDPGTGNQDQLAVYSAYRSFTGITHTNLWLMLGDNAYLTGTDPEYQAKVFDVYPQLFKQSTVWPTIGNHDAVSADSATESGPYYDVFTLPKRAEAGGVASGTEAYYSFNHANIHFVILDSEESGRAIAGPMMAWLKADLQATNADWLIAYWHRPPYTKGSHDSDSTGEPTLTEMRERFVPVLEQYGVDMVLTGHSHSYERSKFINGHYGLSSTFSDATHVIQSGSGKANTDGSGAYLKSVRAVNSGAVYAVPGSSGWISGGPLNHPAMQVSLNKLGSMVLDVNGLTLHARFLESDGSVTDDFTIDKRPTCAVPWGGTLIEGNSVTAFQASVGSTCVSEKRTCSNGTLSGSYTQQACIVSRTVSLQNGLNGYAGNVDTQVARKKRNVRFGNAKNLASSASQGGNGRVAALLKWDLGQLSGTTLRSASLTLSTYDGSRAPYQVYAINKPWDERTATWKRINPTNALGKLVGTLDAGAAGTRQVNLNVDGIALLQGWVSGAQPNYGLMVVDSGSRDTIRFRSSEFNRANLRPSLTVTYQ